MGPPVSVQVEASSMASASIPNGPIRAIDFDTREEPGVASQWLLADGETGWLQLRLAYPTELRRIDILNTSNGGMNDRAAARVRVSIYSGQDLLWGAEGTVRHSPEWTHIHLPPSGLAEVVLIEIESFAGKGGGLNEVRLVAGNPLNIGFDALVRAAWLLTLVAPLWLIWTALKPLPVLARLGFLAGLGVILYGTLWQFLARPSMPMGHEYISHRDRLAIYTAHLLNGDFLPLWGSSSAMGHGSVFPVFYHRLFYYWAMPAYLLTGTIKGAILSTVVSANLTAVAGLIHLLRRIGIKPVAAGLLALAYPHLNYAYYNWTERQALAEYAAMCLVPWMFLWCIACWQGARAKKLFLTGAFLFPAMYFAHSLIFFLSAVPVLAVLTGRFIADAEGRKQLLLWMPALGGVFLLLTAPWLLLQWVLVRTLHFGDVILQYRAEEWMLPLYSYFYNPYVDWGGDVRIKILLDWPLWVMMVAGLCGIVLVRRRAALGDLASPYLLAALAMIGWFMFLQTSLAKPIYDIVPGFSTIQFPWRCLALISPLELVVIGCLGVVLGQYWNTRSSQVQTAVASLALLVTLLVSPFWIKYARGWYDAHLFESIRPAAMGSSAFPSGDYWPRAGEFKKTHDRFDHFLELEPRPSARQWSGDGYSVERLDPHVFEDMEYDYRVSIAEATTVMLPVSFSGMEQLYRRTDEGAWERVPTFRTSEDFRVQFEYGPGQHEFRLLLPSWSALLNLRRP